MRRRTLVTSVLRSANGWSPARGKRFSSTPSRLLSLLSFFATALGPVPAEAESSGDVATTAEATEDPYAADLRAIKYKPGKGLAVSTTDESFSLVTRLRIQILTTVEDSRGQEAALGVMLRRARLQFIGNMFGKHNKFKAELAFSPRDLRMTSVDSNIIVRESPLLTWYVEFDYLRDLTVRAGQYKIPFSRQRVVSSGNQQMVDRSIANGEFNLDRDIGIELRSKDFLGLDRFRYSIGVYNGEGRSAFRNGDSNLMVLGRVEFLPLGIFKDYSESDLERSQRPGLSIGMAYAFAPNAGGVRVNQGGPPADEGTSDYHNITADVAFKYQGLSALGELFWRGGERNPGSAVDENGMPIPAEAPRKGYGWFVQTGYLLPSHPLEFSGRFGQVEGIGQSSVSDLNEAGVGVSYYFAGHPLKLQADLFQLWDGDFQDGITRGRLQLQSAF